MSRLRADNRDAAEHRSCAKKAASAIPLGAQKRLRYPNHPLPHEGHGPSPGGKRARNHRARVPFPSRTEAGKPRMRARRNDDSDTGDLVDPSMGAPQPPQAGPTPRPNPQSHAQVYIGRGEREERAYIPPTALPNIAKPKEDAEKVAISSSVDPRRMQTMRLAPGRPRQPLSPDERPEGMLEEPGAASSQFPPSSVRSSQRGPKSSMAHATISMRAPSPTATSGPPMIVWVLAVALAALIGAGTALWLRRTSPAPQPAPTTAPAPR